MLGLDEDIDTNSASSRPIKSVNIVTDSKTLLGQETPVFRWLYFFVKWMFICINGFCLGLFFYLLFAPNAILWTPETALIILGIFFGIVLCFVALFGAIKEECYIILTYNIFVAVIYVVSVYYTWRSLPEEISLFFYLLLSFLFAHLLHRKNPTPAM